MMTIIFTGAWTLDERMLVRQLIRDTDKFLNAHMPSPWTFEKTPTGVTVTQPSLLVNPFMAASLLTVCERVRRVAVVTEPWVTYSE